MSSLSNKCDNPVYWGAVLAHGAAATLMIVAGGGGIVGVAIGVGYLLLLSAADAPNPFVSRHPL